MRVNGDENALLKLAASIEQGSEHPLGAAIVAAAKERSLEQSSVVADDRIAHAKARPAGDQMPGDGHAVPQHTTATPDGGTEDRPEPALPVPTSGRFTTYSGILDELPCPAPDS